MTLYPSAQFLTSYDAGRGQRYYLYGATASVAELVAYYRTLLKQRGAAIFDNPPIYIFEIGKYDENTMAFPPSVTIKDYTLDGNGGYLNPQPGRHARAVPDDHPDRAGAARRAAVARAAAASSSLRPCSLTGRAT